MSDNRSSKDIEREIEEERSALSRSLEELQHQFSPERLVGTVTDTIRNNGGDVSRSVMNAVKENPMAVALTGIGLAWLIAGSSRSSQRHDYDYERDEDYLEPYDPYDASYGPGATRPVGTPAVGAGGSDRDGEYSAASARAPLYARPDHDPYEDDDEVVAWGRVSATGSEMKRGGRYESAKHGAQSRYESAKAGAEGRYESAKSRAEQGYQEARGKAERTGAEMKGKAQAYGARAWWRAEEMRNQGYARASELRERITDGTERLSAGARDRVVRARARAYEAQREIETRSRYAAQATRDKYYEQPLVAGAIAMGLGAALGAALPRTEREDHALGGYRDQLFDEADRIFREETAKLQHVAEAAVEEGQEVAREKMSAGKEKMPHGKEAVDKAESEVKSAAQRVRDAAQKEADKQNLGKPS